MSVAVWLFGAGGVLLAAIGVFFLAFRPSLLAEDLRFLGRSGAEIDQSLPGLRRWLRRVFMVLGGHALAAGVLTVAVATTGVRDGNPVAVAALAVAGSASIGVMTVVNFTIRSAFRWTLVGVAGLWAAATAAAIWT